MTNKEWLDYLAHNAPDELSAWFDAEHIENQERALEGDTEPESEDSREQLEADIKKYRWEHSETSGRVTEWLDRQAAITLAKYEAYCQECNGDYYKLQDERDELQAKVDELKAELTHFERFKNKVIPDLRAERDQWRDAAGTVHDMWEQVVTERNNWKANCEDWKKDCERYRSKFGKCIDYADAIHALMDDEGMA